MQTNRVYLKRPASCGPTKFALRPKHAASAGVEQNEEPRVEEPEPEPSPVNEREKVDKNRFIRDVIESEEIEVTILRLRASRNYLGYGEVAETTLPAK